MSLFVAAIGATVTAIVELTVGPYIRVGNAQPHLVCVFAVVLTIARDAEDFPRELRIEVSDDRRAWSLAWEGPVAWIAFVAALQHPAEMPVPIPRILDHDEELGILALQDLGDVTLQAHLGTAPFPVHAALYRQGVAHIATLQRRGAELASPAYMPYAVAFDVEKLTWEMDFFIKHFIEAYRGIVIPPAARS